MPVSQPNWSLNSWPSKSHQCHLDLVMSNRVSLKYVHSQENAPPSVLIWPWCDLDLSTSKSNIVHPCPQLHLSSKFSEIPTKWFWFIRSFSERLIRDHARVYTHGRADRLRIKCLLRRLIAGEGIKCAKIKESQNLRVNQQSLRPATCKICSYECAYE